MFKTQPITPLETIYEESGSFATTASYSLHESRDESIYGLISARSIPSVDIERQRANESEKKLPIEVRFRDGSKRFIHPSTTATMIINRRNLLNSSQEHLFTKPPLVFTIITADDLRQAGLTPSISSTASGSDLSVRSQSQGNSPFVGVKSIEDIQQALMKRSSATPIQSPVITTSTPSLRSSASLLSNSHQSVTHTHSEELTPAKLILSPANQSIVSSTKVSIPSQSSTSTSNENERNIISNSTLSSTTIVHRRTPSAFHPVLKPARFINQPISIKPQLPLITTEKPFYPPSSIQQQSIIPSQPHPNQYPSVPISNSTRIFYPPSILQTTKVQPNYTYNTIGPTRKDLQIISNHNSLLPVNAPYYPEKSKPAPSNFDQLLTNFSPTYSNIKWHSITPNSIYDIPHLSSKYSNIPLRITLPVTSIHNQNLVVKHNPVLEKRLLNAGLSPETVALYERILDVAENRQKIFFSAPQILNQYSY